jgi:hypothetical protein
MDYLKESEQVSITQIVTAYVSCLMICTLSVVNATLHSKSPLIVVGWSILAMATIVSVVYGTRKIGNSLKL